MITLMYVSVSTLSPQRSATATDEIVRSAIVRNASLSVTGALISTDRHFAQVLEGPPEYVDELMLSIRTDGRHRDLKVVDRRQINQRRFRKWEMAFTGSARYVDEPIQRLLESEAEGGRRPYVERIYAIMSEFTKI